MIQRYTRGSYRRIEKHDCGELCFYIDVEKDINAKDDLINKLSKNNEELYKQWNEMSLKYNKIFDSKKSLLDKLIALKILNKKNGIICFVSMMVNIVLIGVNYL